MYATWVTYNIVTDMGAKKEVLRSTENVLTSSPCYFGVYPKELTMVDKVGTAITKYSWANYGFGARSALYQEGTPE